ncbi:MAG: hypothetical protein JWM87_3672 [Candidatus Eremiobacteraeota bacterium]|nr:hypothetical protein [Candidatus Eremiobacteraeota bacterium]
MKTITSVALIALLAGCSGGASSVPSSNSVTTTSAAVRAPQTTGGPGTTSITYLDTYAPVGQCVPGKLSINNGFAPATHLSFPAGEGPPLVLSNCHFTTPHYVRVTLGEPEYGTPFVRQTDYTVTVDAPGPAQVTATWTDLGPTLPGTPGLKGKVTFTIGPPSSGGGL